MTASRARLCTLAATAAAAVMLIPPAGAAERPLGRSARMAPALLAQAAPPVRLAPRRAVEAAPAPAIRPPPMAETPPGKRPGKRKVLVEIRKLSAVDPDSVGVIDSTQGGFGVDMWEGTDRILAGKLLPLLPGRVGSRVMRDLMHRLLLTRATAPQGKPGKPGKPSLLATRVQRLFAMGNIEAARQLLDSAPSHAFEENLTRIRIESLFFGNDNSGACKNVRSNIRRYQGTYWQQATAFCLALGGEHAKATLVADILAEREGGVDPAFFTVMDVLSGTGNTPVESLKDPSALQLSMMRAANLRLPSDAAQSRKPPILRAVALSPNADLDVRLAAAEAARTLGALGPAELGELYAGIKFENKELENPLTTAEVKWGPRGRALLLRSAAGQKVPTARAEVLKRAWRLAREKGGFDLILMSSLPTLLTIEPAGELIWFAQDAARALFGAGRRAEAMAWLALAQAEAATNAEAAAATIALWPLAVLSDLEETIPFDPAMLEKWWQAHKGDGGIEAIDRARLLFSLLTALDKPIGTGLWSRVIGNARPVTAEMPNPALRHALRVASEDLRIGETVLLALIMLGEKGADGADAMAVEAAVAALRTVGLRKEARALALGAAIAAGL